MTGRKRGRATWFNVYATIDGRYTRDKMLYGSKTRAQRQAEICVRFQKRRLLYRIRVRYFLEPIT